MRKSKSKAKLYYTDGKVIPRDDSDVTITGESLYNGIDSAYDVGFNTATIISGAAVLLSGLAMVLTDWIRKKNNK